MAAKRKRTAKRERPKKFIRKTQAKSVQASFPSEQRIQAQPQSATPIQKVPRRSFVATIVIILLIIGLLYVFRSSFIVATVNGEPVSRISFNKELEKESGKRALNALITKKLILQEANKKHVAVSDKEIDSEMKKISDTLGKQGQKLDQALIARGITQDDLREQIRIEKLIEKLLSKDIQVSDQEVNNYMDKYNKAVLASSTDQNNPTGNTDEAEATQSANQKITKEQAKEQLKQEKLTNKLQPWLQKLQNNAKITYFVKY